MSRPRVLLFTVPSIHALFRDIPFCSIPPTSFPFLSPPSNRQQAYSILIDLVSKLGVGT